MHEKNNFLDIFNFTVHLFNLVGIILKLSQEASSDAKTQHLDWMTVILKKYYKQVDMFLQVLVFDYGNYLLTKKLFYFY